MSDSAPSNASADSSSNTLVAVARILGAHGRDGAIRVKTASDVPGRFDAGNSLSGSRDGVTAEDQTYQIVMSRSIGKDELILWFRGFRDRSQAQRLTGLWLCVPQFEVPSAAEGEYFHFQLIGLSVHTVEGEELGEIAEILETGSNDVYVVASRDREILIPALTQVVHEIDIARGLMIVDLPEGLR